MDSSLIDDIIAFINSNPNVIGVDSLLTILLPKSEGIELLIHTNPQYLLDYAKVSIQMRFLFRVSLINIKNIVSDRFLLGEIKLVL